MSSPLHLPPVARFSGSVRPPGSKSIANRALPLAACARGETRLENLPDGEDVTLMRAALEKLGVPMVPEAEGLRIRGLGRAPGSGAGSDSGELELFLGNSGTATRILSALLAAGEGVFRIDGVPRMRERPIGDLVDALRALAGAAGTRVEYAGREGFPPLRIAARGLEGGKAKIRGDASSQFVTGLLLALPLCRRACEVEVEGRLVSAPYVDLTLRVMEAFGAHVERDGLRFRLRVPRGYDSPGAFRVEPDASSASYFLAAGAIAGGPVTVLGLGKDSAQGELGFAEVLRRMGARVEFSPDGVTVSRPADPDGKPAPLRGVDLDMDALSDTAMTLAVAALFAEGPTAIRNVGNWRLKETDRLKAMAAELRKVGAEVEEGEDSLRIRPPKALRAAEIETYQDHRMAMCFSLAALGPSGIAIRDPGCVAKTYPGYFEDFRRLAEGGS